MKKEFNKEISSPHLSNLRKELQKIEREGRYLETERKRLIKIKKNVRNKINKEKKILNLKRQIERVKTVKRKK